LQPEQVSLDFRLPPMRLELWVVRANPAGV
jgi:hypothetical protein